MEEEATVDVPAETIEEEVAPPRNGFSPELDELRRTGPCEQLPTAERESDLGLSHSIQPQDTEEEAEEQEEESVEKQGIKRAMRSIVARTHPDIMHKPSEKDLDPNSPDLKFKEKLWKLGLPPEQHDTDSDDEEFRIPTQSYWRKICLSIWGMGDDDAVISRMKATKQTFDIYTNGWYNDHGDSGCGAILHDCFHRPIVAMSKVIPKEKCVSPFYIQLEGVALGVKLAKKYNAFQFYLYCPSEAVCSFVMQNWDSKAECFCSGKWVTVQSRCRVCSEMLMYTEHHKDHEKAFELGEEIFSDISDLEKLGLRWFDVSNDRDERNEAAYHVAKLKKDGELNLKEICESEELWGLIYKEMFGLYFK